MRFRPLRHDDREPGLNLRPASRVVFALVAIAIGAYYSWGVRAAGHGFVWKQNLDGYYDHLGRAFAGGHLYLPVEPSPELLKLANPWDPRVDDSLKLFDAVLYHRRYYLYHGAGPAVMLFAPWRLITHHDLPENFALFVFCFGGFLFSGATLLSTVRTGPWTTALLLLALGLCQCVPFLLNRVWVYEVAVGAGYFCVSAGLFFYVRGWLPWAGLMFGLAISCRPHLGMIGAIIVAVLAFRNLRSAIAFALPFALAGLGVAAYNYERFGNPLDFGNRYLLGGANQTEVKLSAANVKPGLFYLLASSPEFDAVFPWVLLPSPPHDVPRPPGYTVEPTVGAIYLAPFLPFVFLTVWIAPHRKLCLILLGSVAGILLFVTGTGWSTQRYEVDFLPMLVLVCAILVASINRWYVTAAVALLVGVGIVVNLALGISGPLDEMLKNRPDRFVKIARWLSPAEELRPILNPAIDLRFHVQEPKAMSYRQILFAAGRAPLRYELYVESIGGQRTLVSTYNGLTASRELPAPPADYRIQYSAPSYELRVSAEGAEILKQKIGALVTSPSQILHAGMTVR